MNISNEKYKQHLKHILEVRKIINKFNIKSLRFNYPLIGRWSLTPWSYFLYFKQYIKMIQNLYLKNYYKFPKTDYICISGDQGKFDIFRTGVKKLYFPHFDYLIFKKKQKDLSISKNYFVYLDQNIQFSHDKNLVNIKSNFSKFEVEVNRFLLLLKKKYNTEIIIASHPKRDLKKKTILTKNWKIIKGDTAKIISKSKLVIMHDTMSISYPVLMSKPLIFITTDQLEKTFYSQSIDNFSKFFCKSKINVSEINESSLEIKDFNLFSINKKKYKKYINNFIVSKNNKTLSFSIILKRIIKKVF